MRKWWYNHNMEKEQEEVTEENTGAKHTIDKKKVFLTTISSLGIVGLFIGLLVDMGAMKEKTNSLDKRIDENVATISQRIADSKQESGERFNGIESDLAGIKEDIGKLYASINEISYNLGVAEGKLDIIPLRAEGQIGAAVMSFSYVKNDDVYLSKPSFSEGVVAIGLDDKEYSAKDLQNQPVIIPYLENGQEVFFQGQFNENNQWDGECLINVYEDGVFVIATEAMYDNGKRKEYQQLFPNGNEWVYSKRIDQDTFNGGDTWTYEKITDGKQTISFENPDPADMIRPSEVEYESGADLISHYHGNTSDGKYNDDSGEAYLIEYYEDGYTRLVYQGKFANGLQEDNTGNAWQIARNKVTGTDYMLYKGVFEAGEQTHKDGEVNDWENPLSSTKLKQYTEGKPFEDELHFDMEFIAE